MAATPRFRTIQQNVARPISRGGIVDGEKPVLNETYFPEGRLGPCSCVADDQLAELCLICLLQREPK